MRSRIDLEAILDLHAYDGLARQPAKFADEEHCIEATGVTTVTLRHGCAPVSLYAVETFLQVVYRQWPSRLSCTTAEKCQNIGWLL